MTRADDKNSSADQPPPGAEENDVVDVLIVDDDPNIRLLVEDILLDPGRRLHFAQSGSEGLRLLRKMTPAVILLDVVLGDMDGFEVAQLTRRSRRLENVPIVFMTGQATSDNASFDAYDLGAIDYLLKPIAPRILAGKVSVLCQLAQRTMELRRQRDELDAARTELAAANEALKRIAVTDPLTQLKNRRALMDHLRWLRDSQRREPRLHGIAVLDLDHFKAVNDTLGHAAGDQVLVEAARRLETVGRPYDIVARLGGDEFCIVIHDLSGSRELREIGGRIQRTMARPYELADGVQATTPASLGMTMMLADDERGFDALLQDADKAMYQAKLADGAHPILQDPSASGNNEGMQ